MSVRRFFGGSLSIQIALVMAGALLVASLVNFAILMGERSRAGINEQSGPAIGRFVVNASEVFNTPPAGSGMVVGLRPQGGGRYLLMDVNPIDQRDLQRDQGLEQRLRRALDEANIEVQDIRGSTRISTRTIERPDRNDRQERGRRQAGNQNTGPAIMIVPLDARGQPVDFGLGGPGGPGGPGGFGQRGPGGPDGGFGPGPGGPGEARGIRQVREIVLAAQLPDGRWFSGSNFAPQPPGGDFVRLAAGTLITFLFVLAAALWIARRLSRPLNDLTHAAAQVGSAGEPQEVAVRGPADVRQTLEAFNAMSRRVSQLLGEKDVMLGALGHDLRTPLASLRIRLETMEPESERDKAVKTIEEASRLLEDILELARHGRSKEPVQPMDVSVLVEDMVEDYSETGMPVSLTSSQKTPVGVRPVLFRRALSNLIDNAVTYGERARLSVQKVGNEALVRIEDDGPGMSEESLKSAADPFYRGDTSRNRRTGGAGLGLTLADAIAKAHGGSLELENRKPNGLVATIRLPIITPQAQQVAPPQTPPSPATPS
ncbi:MAG TPA: ATP-binding protein [Hyphomonadaceae bacterium]|nr:ATP-binding protein [Hyphomonadaceae bacterium]